MYLTLNLLSYIFLHFSNTVNVQTRMTVSRAHTYQGRWCGKIDTTKHTPGNTFSHAAIPPPLRNRNPTQS